MQQAKHNPQENTLQAGIQEEDLEEAIRKSGYPLQTIVANSLRDTFSIHDEWCFIDKTEGTLRNIDILAEKRLYSFEQSEKRVRPILNLLIECKQSDYPYIFFLSPKSPRLPYFPFVSGIFSEKIKLYTDDDPSTLTVPVIDALGLSNHEFIQGDVPTCMSLARAARKGKSLILTGSDAFNNLVHPLVKSIQYHQQHHYPPKTAYYHDCRLTLPIAILDAPMVGVDHQQKLISLPWVRIVRTETIENGDWLNREKRYGLDVVHRNFFDDYLKKHLLPFSEQFSTAALSHHEELATGKGFIEGLGACIPYSYSEMTPYNPTPIQRPASILRHIFNNVKKVTTKSK